MYKLDKNGPIGTVIGNPNEFRKTIKHSLYFTLYGVTSGAIYGILYNFPISEKLIVLYAGTLGALIFSTYKTSYHAKRVYGNYKKENLRWSKLTGEYTREFTEQELKEKGFKTPQELANERFVHDAYKNDKVVPITPFLRINEEASSQEKGYSKVLTKNGSGNNLPDDGKQI